jgi:hypothetical protein
MAPDMDHMSSILCATHPASTHEELEAKHILFCIHVYHLFSVRQFLFPIGIDSGTECGLESTA